MKNEVDVSRNKKYFESFVPFKKIRGFQTENSVLKRNACVKCLSLRLLFSISNKKIVPFSIMNQHKDSVR